MKRWNIAIRLTGLWLLIMVATNVTAQEDLGWITDLLPDGNNINIDKQVQQGALDILAGSQILDESFDFLNAWEDSSGREGNREVRNGRYEMRLLESDLIYTGLGTTEYNNVIMTVDTQGLSAEPNDGYGLVCRASDEENGVHFYISSDGFWRIFAFDNGRARPFMPWTASDLINQGENASNRITAVCVDNYFALYINGELVGEAQDDRFTSGLAGMSVIVFEEDSEVFIAFDNLRIWEAEGTGEAVVATNNVTTDNNSNELDDQRAATILLLEEGGESVILNDLLLFDDFEDADDWVIIEDDEGSEIEVDDGIVYTISPEGAIYPALILSEQTFGDTVVQAEITFEDGDENNAYGLICRSSDFGRGYHFNISADGFYTVWVTDGEAYRTIVEWERDTAINVNATNTMTAVCIDDYLAFYVNDALLVDLYDSIYEIGAIGLSAFTFEDDSELSFDNIYIWDAALP